MMLTICKLLFLGNIGPTEWIIIAVLLVFMFGGKKIPELARGLGRGIREFKDASKEVKKEINEGIKEDDTKNA